jgi:hypothetical protein
VLVSLIVISKFTKEVTIFLPDQAANPMGFPLYSIEEENTDFPPVSLPARPTPNTYLLKFN